MTKLEFVSLDITQQQDLIKMHGKFIKSQAVGNYLCDTYQYEAFYVIFFCLIARPGITNCQCFDNTNHIRHFINSIDRPMS